MYWTWSWSIFSTSIIFTYLKGICFLHKKLDVIKKLKGPIFTFPTSIPECFSVQGLGLIGIKELNNQFQCYHIEFDQPIKLNTEIPLEAQSKSIKIEDILNSFVPIRVCIRFSAILYNSFNCQIHKSWIETWHWIYYFWEYGFRFWNLKLFVNKIFVGYIYIYLE